MVGVSGDDGGGRGVGLTVGIMPWAWPDHMTVEGSAIAIR